MSEDLGKLLAIKMLIIDIQGFQYARDNFLCKEIAFINTENGYSTHRFVKMPTDLSYYTNPINRHMKYVTKNIHGIEWENNDNLEYEQVSEYLLNCIGTECTLFVKGLEKKQWLQKLLPSVTITDLADEGCPSFGKLKSFLRSNHCESHLCNNTLSCALENVHFLWYWFVNCRNQNKLN